jgi:hemolysin III
MYRGERFNSITHLIGTCLAAAGLVILIVLAARAGDVWKMVSFSIYGTTLVMLYLFSTLYHSMRGEPKRVLQKLDHAAIYLLIAGTYTPFTLVTLRGAWGWSLFGIVWGLAFIGLIQDILLKKRRHILSVAIYLVMGWLVVTALRPLASHLPGMGMIYLTAGGLFYTLGVAFYALDSKIPHGHGIFHVLVLAGSASHYIAILLYVA